MGGLWGWYLWAYDCIPHDPLIAKIAAYEFGHYTIVMDRDTNDVTLIRYVNRLSIPTGHSPIFQSSYQNFRD